MVTPALDSYDKAILWELQQDNRQSNARLGERVGLSEPAVRRRVRRLRQAGHILADVSLIKTDRVGITVAILVRFEKESQQTYDAFKAQIAKTRAISQCYTVTGDEDFLLIGHFDDMVAYDDWVNGQLLTNPAISRSTTHVVYRRTKFETAVPL